MTIDALRQLLDEELPDVPRHPAPPIPRRRFSANDTPEEAMPTTTSATPSVSNGLVDPPAAPALADEPTQAVEELPVDELLDWGDAHPDSAVQDQALRARTALAGLRTRHAADSELAAISSRTEELERELAGLRAREAELQPARKARRRPGGSVDSATVRAWAQSAGVECPAKGRVPARVVDAWRQATFGTASA